MPSPLDRVRVVLYEPQDPVNIAGTVRAMANMGVHALYLVRPVEYDPVRLEGIAHHTRTLIDGIVRCEDFDAAVEGCVRVVGFTARRRAARRAITAPREEAADAIAATAEGPVAYVFGREDSGLPNEILDRVHATVMIPTSEHASLNLAQAVLVGLYELHLAAPDATRDLAPPRKAAPPPTPEQFEQYFTDYQRSLDTIEFFKTRVSEHIMRTVRSLTYRADPDSRELSLMRAMALEVMNFLNRVKRS